MTTMIADSTASFRYQGTPSPGRGKSRLSRPPLRPRLAARGDRDRESEDDGTSGHRPPAPGAAFLVFVAEPAGG